MGEKWTLQPCEGGFCNAPKYAKVNGHLRVHPLVGICQQGGGTIVAKKDVEGTSNKLEDDSLLNLDNPPVFDYCFEENCEVCLRVGKAFDMVFGETKQVEFSVIKAGDQRGSWI
ncbi:unnamed protein product [Prunus armeniaca]